MDGRKRAHTGAQNEEGGKIRGLLARGQEQRIFDARKATAGTLSPLAV
jgi:hypothetical protein